MPLQNPQDVAAHSALDTGIHGVGASTVCSLAQAPVFVRKTADETVNNSNALQDDDELLFALGANEVWFFQAIIIGISTAVADFIMSFVMPAGGVIHGFKVVMTAADAFSGNTLLEGDGLAWTVAGGAADRCYTILQGLAINGATPGDLQFRWAQNTAEASDSKILENSCLYLDRLL